MKKTILIREIKHLRIIGDDLKKEFKHLEKLNFHLIKHDKETNIITVKVFSHNRFTLTKKIHIGFRSNTTGEYSYYNFTGNIYKEVFKKNELNGMTYKFGLNANKVILI